MKLFTSAFLFLLLCGSAVAQDLAHWYGSARITLQGGLTYHFGAEFTGDVNGQSTIKLTSEFDSSEWRGFNLRPATVEIGVPLFVPYGDGNFLKARFGIRVSTDNYVAVIVPSSLAVQRALATMAASRNVSADVMSRYPINCTGAYAVFGGQVPCESDGAIVVH